MTVVPLTPTQSAAVELLCAGGRLEAVPADLRRAGDFVTHAVEAMLDLPNLTRAHTRYHLAYDAAHDAGEAMQAADGLRTRSGPGQHEALGRFLAAVFDQPPAREATRHWDQMRRDRNRNRYSARPVTGAAAAAAEAAATAMVSAARQRLVLDHPGVSHS